MVENNTAAAWVFVAIAIVLLVVLLTKSGKKEEVEIQGFWNRGKGTKLKGNEKDNNLNRVINTLEDVSLQQCADACRDNNNCTSFNYYKDNKECRLLNSSLEVSTDLDVQWWSKGTKAEFEENKKAIEDLAEKEAEKTVEEYNRYKRSSYGI